MTPIADYHMHTPLCGHAKGAPADYAAQAVALGLSEIGFSDHAPLVSHRDKDITMDFDELPTYHRMIEDVRDQYAGRLTVRIGIEADYMPGFEDRTKEILAGYPYDYVIGSVHYIEKWAFDNPIQMQTWDEKDIDDVYKDYFDLLRRSAASGLFDIMGHVDLVKKFGHRPSQPLLDEVERTAAVFRDAGVAIEINTSGLRKEAQEIYPSLAYLKIFARAGVPMTFGSDAHAPDQVGHSFAVAADYARKAGYTDYCLFANRKIVDKVGLL